MKTGDLESRIALILSDIDDPTNHSVPILDTFVDSVDESISYLVMPFLRVANDPVFDVVEEVVDFADQALEVRSCPLKIRSIVNRYSGPCLLALTPCSTPVRLPVFCDQNVDILYTQKCFPQAHIDGRHSHISTRVSPFER